MQLISLFTDENDVVIDPVAGSAVTLLAAAKMKRKSYGFEIKKNYFKEANEKILNIADWEVYGETKVNGKIIKQTNIFDFIN